ncbi:allophanate hydrolase [Luedemannella helvata]|uniref:Allophanate hydrolase n=1 Tax=Luedemannella helvata TaxID=349315 RepID=A0ABN2KKI6_9ACTN
MAPGDVLDAAQAHGPAAASRAAHAAPRPAWINLVPTADVVRRAAAVEPDAPLAGVPFGIKDNLDLAGLPTTSANPALADAPAATSAVAVARLAAAGAVAIGKTNMDQFATGLVGTRSPYGACACVADPAYVSGGSSSGSAVAVASGVVPLALATDTAGSGRVPAAFNGLVGIKPTRGLVSTRGLAPACRSLDCVTTLSRTVGLGRSALAALVWTDPEDPWSRPRPPHPPAGVATTMRVVAVPAGPLDLDPAHAAAWDVAVARLRRLVPHVVEVDISAFLAAAKLLYEGPFLAERWAGFGHLLDPDGPHLDPTVRGIVARGAAIDGASVFAAQDTLAGLRRATDGTWADIDALMLPVTPNHPTRAEVAADPVGVNRRLGTYTNFVNLLDLCAVAVPADPRADGLPYGVQFVAPAFADDPLLDLAGAWCGEATPVPPVPGGSSLLAVAGAHMSGLALNPQLTAAGGVLRYRARTAPAYRLFRLNVPGVARPGLVRTGDGPAGGVAVEVWQLPHQGVGALLDLIPAPLGLGRVELDDGTLVTGFLAEEYATRDATDVTHHGSWRAALAAVA